VSTYEAKRTWRSDKLAGLGSSIFAEVAEWKQMAAGAGLDVIDLGIGSPDQPPNEAIRQALSKAALSEGNYAYPSSAGSSAFRKQAARWMKFRFGVTVDPDREIIALMGSQDGLAHLAMAVCNPGDQALVPDPGYPIYHGALVLAGVKPILLPLRAENGFLPDLDSLSEETWRSAVFLLLGFPGNPIATAVDYAYLEKLVALARKWGVLLVHDLAYSEMGFDGYRPISVLQVPGAADTAVEFHSFSKSFNMAGCRIGFLAGNREAIGALRELKSNIDFGVFESVQEAAIAALALAMGAQGADAGERVERAQRTEGAKGTERAEDGEGAVGSERLAGTVSRHLQVAPLYEQRRNVMVDALAQEGWQVPKPAATMFIWAQLPVRSRDKLAPWESRTFARELLLRTGVAVIPGDAFGKEGEGYVRIALVETEERLREAARRIGMFLRDEG
jgi:aspartate/methionine/tyrosine aminotransferase